MSVFDGLRIILGALVFVIMVNVSQADWATITPEELQQQSDLIVVGKLIDIKAGIGFIKVCEVFKGKSAEDVVLLRVPVATGGFVLSSTDVSFDKGQQGLWYLQLLDDGRYGIDRPDRFIIMDLAKERVESFR